jgi:Domain of unknown function (DUF222)/HNH endonuclease
MFDTRLHEYWEPSRTDRSCALMERMGAARRVEAAAAADRLDAIGELFELRRAERGEQQDWAVDTWAAVGAEVAAALRISLAMAGSYMRYALAMRERLPRVAEVFRAGEIDYDLFATMVYRSDLITDAAALARLDAELALRVPRWASMTRGRLAAKVDSIVARVDADAVRRNKDRMKDREVYIWESEPGIAEMHGRLFGADASALDQRLDAMADSVCAKDPRTRDQRRADALGALAVGADRLGCNCGTPDCAAGGRSPGPVVIHVVAEQATLEGRSTNPAATLSGEELMSAPLTKELAENARLRPLISPTVAEPHYIPSAKLADFVRCRDLTCRAPGCDRPAIDCDVDHTIPYSQGGATHPSNLKCLCRQHHLIKTFWGWGDHQLPDGTVIWTAPGGQTYVTTPGSALLFPTLCAPTGEPPPLAAPRADHCAERTAMMPLRSSTRAENRAHRVAAERHQNRKTRLVQRTGPAPPPEHEPPPF